MTSQSATMMAHITGLVLLVSLQAASSHWMSAGTLQPLSTVNLSDQLYTGQPSDNSIYKYYIIYKYLHQRFPDVSTPGSLVTEFHGNSSHTDHFKLLKEDGTSVLVGARNIIYNLSLPDLQEYSDQVHFNWLISFILSFYISRPSLH